MSLREFQGLLHGQSEVDFNTLYGIGSEVVSSASGRPKRSRKQPQRLDTEDVDSDSSLSSMSSTTLQDLEDQVKQAEEPQPKRLKITQKNSQPVNDSVEDANRVSGQRKKRVLKRNKLGTKAANKSNARRKIPRNQTTTKSPRECGVNDHSNKIDTSVPAEDALNDQSLLSLAEKLFAASNQVGERPYPVGKPHVYADNRQDLCETLPYFRSTQGGCYSKDGVIRGFMFDKESVELDYTDDEVIISRSGGGMEKNKERKMVLGRNQIEQKQTVDLRRNQERYIPVVIIVGNDNATLQYRPEHTYDVLGHFIVADIWYEKVGSKATARYRFEKLESTKESWFKPSGVDSIAKLGTLPPPIRKSCPTCKKESYQVFTCGWMCVADALCTSFFKLSNGRDPIQQSLRYDPRFLKKKTDRPHECAPFDLKPESPASNLSILGEDYSESAARGICCPQCGRCGVRNEWFRWKCRNEHCGHEILFPHPIIPPGMLRDATDFPIGERYAFSDDILDSSLVTLTTVFDMGLRISKYKLLGMDGCIFHIHANTAYNQEPGGADDIFLHAQQKGFDLQRRLKKRGQIKGDRFTAHFLKNFGAHYKFINEVATSPFTEAPQPIKNARARLNWFATYVLGAEKHKVPFNECLAVGYFESQRMKFHDDNEDGLGPVVASESYGYPGIMKFRMKQKHFKGVHKDTKLLTQAPPRPGCQAYDLRKERWDEITGRIDAARAVQGSGNYKRRKSTGNPQEDDDSDHEDDGEDANPNVNEVRLKIATELGLVPAKSPKRKIGSLQDVDGEAKEVRLEKNDNRQNAPVILELHLNHGDIVIMASEDLQEYYEHQVEHKGPLRFALTCRHIGSKSGDVESDEGDEDDTVYSGPAWRPE